eukprot:evm.model.scf_105.13 EVM.evm.TU.scf_105.13   scf_105:121340-126612(-)
MHCAELPAGPARPQGAAGRAPDRVPTAAAGALGPAASRGRRQRHAAKGNGIPDENGTHPNKAIERLLFNNRQWAKHMASKDPKFFPKCAEGQSPEYLWIGCSDSRVVTNTITGLQPGEIFTHRNVGNIVAHGDLNCMSVVEYAVGSLKVKHVIVCGHYGCGACDAALRMPMETPGMLNSWISRIRDVKHMWASSLEQLPEEERLPRLCELNAITQALHMCDSAPIQAAWAAGQELCVYGMIYGLGDGALTSLIGPISSAQQAREARQSFEKSGGAVGAASNGVSAVA